MATSPNTPASSNTPGVQTANVFVYNGSNITSVLDTGSFGVNAIIHRDATPRARVDTINIPDAPSAVIAGGAETTKVLPTLANVRGIGTVGTVIGIGNDLVAIGQRVWQGNGAEAVTEAAGVAGLAWGALAGVRGGAAFGTLILPGAGTVAGALFLSSVGALGVSLGGKELGAYLTGGDTPDKLGPPLTLPGNLNIPPTVTRADGNQYALVEVDGKATWFSISSPQALVLGAAPYTEVVRGQVVAELTTTYLDASGYRPQLEQYQAQVTEQNRAVLQDAFMRSEVDYANSFGPNGLPWGATVSVASNASQTWKISPQPGEALVIHEIQNSTGVITRIVTSVDRGTGASLSTTAYESSSFGDPNSFRLIATIDHVSGSQNIINRDTGMLEHSFAVPMTQPLAVARPPSSTFVISQGERSATLTPGGTVSDIVLLQNLAGNPITSDDIREANPGLVFANVQPGVVLNIPRRDGSNLTVFGQNGSFETTNTATGDITRVTPNVDGTTIIVLSAVDGDDGRVVRTLTVDPAGEQISESRYFLNTRTGEQTPFSLATPSQQAAPDPTEHLFNQTVDAFSNTPNPGPEDIFDFDSRPFGNLPQSETTSQNQTAAQREATQQFQSAVNLANTILSLANFDDLSALQRLSLTASLVNAVTQQIRLIDRSAISFTGVSDEALGVAAIRLIDLGDANGSPASTKSIANKAIKTLTSCSFVFKNVRLIRTQAIGRGGCRSGLVLRQRLQARASQAAANTQCPCAWRLAPAPDESSPLSH